MIINFYFRNFNNPWQVFVLLYFFSNSISFSQEKSKEDNKPSIGFEITAMANGLNSSDISALYQDNYGFIWVGTQSGISRFNGHQYINFTKSKNSFLGKIQSIVEDDVGTLWIAGVNGVFFYEKGEFYQSTLSIKDVKVLHFENDHLWVGGHGFVPFGITSKDLLELKKNEIIKISPIVSQDIWEEKVGQLLVRDIDLDENNRIWLAAHNKRISYDGNKLHVHLWEDNSEIHDYTAVKAVSNDSIFWGSEDSGVVLLRKNKFSELTQASTHIIASSGTKTYFLTTQRLVELKKGELNTLYTFSTYSNLYFKKMIVDKEGNFWIGAEGNLLKLTPNYFKRWSFPKEPLLQSSHSISQLASGEILIGSTKEKILSINNDKITSYSNIIAPHNSLTAAIYNDKNNWIWYATSMGGLVVDRNGKYEVYSEKEGLGNKGQYFFYNSSDDLLWSGGEHGITQIVVDKDKTISFNNFKAKTDKIEMPLFRSIFESPDKSVWAVSDKGLFVLNNDELNQWVFSSPLTPSPIFTNAIVAANGQLWLSTQGEGVWQCEFNEKNEPRLIHQWTVKDGLASDVVLDILVDKTNRLWVAGQSSICSLNFEQNSPIIRCFDEADGWHREPTPHSRLMESDDGYLWSVGLTEISAIPLYNLPKNEVVANTFISKVELFDGKENIHQYAENKQNNNQLPTKLALPFNKNFLTFHFGTTSYIKPEKNSFKYKLVGIDQDWNKPVNNKEVFYSGLQPGDYTFNVLAANSDNVSAISPATFSFTILPPWYKSWLAYLTYFIILSSLIYWFYHFQLSKKLAIAEHGKLKEINTLKSNLYTNITHEFRTPLTVILGLADTVKEDIKTQNYNHAKESMGIIERNGKDLLLLVNQLLGISKAESGTMELNLIQADIIPFLRYICESFQSLAETKNIDITTYFETENLPMDFDDGKFQIIISNLLSNAIKFSADGKKIIFHVKKESNTDPESIIIKVKDNGIGIPENSIAHVFDRFYQVDNALSKTGKGTGIGLALTKELVTFMNGTISVKSIESKGTEFTVTIPITRNATFSTKTKSSPINFLQDEDEEKEWSLQLFETDSNLPKALIIEDNKDVAYYLNLCLQEKYHCVFANNGSLGLEKAFDSIPDIIICDVMMPEQDGFEVCKILKTDARTDHIPVILLTAKTSEKDRLKGLQQGADAYLTKPFLKAELLTRLDQLILLRKRITQSFAKNKFSQILNSKENTPETKFLQKAIQIIQSNIDNPNLGSRHVAQKMNMSESQLYRKLKAITGKSTAVFIRSVRLEKAKDLIQTTEKSISEIAYEVGFNDPSWFSRAFKEEFGEPPSAMHK